MPEKGAKVGMLELTGLGLKALETALEQKQALMATIGARLLEQQPRVNETATSVVLRQGAATSTLAAVAASVSAGLMRVLRLAAWWFGLDGADVAVSLNQDFYPGALDAQEIGALVLWQAGDLARDALLQLAAGRGGSGRRRARSEARRGARRLPHGPGAAARPRGRGRAGPVRGTGTFVWWENQIDPALRFGIPMGCWRTLDGKCGENNQTEPDIRVANEREVMTRGRDQQIEAAVKELMTRSKSIRD